MKLKKCPNNHFYDAKTSEFCPHCPASVPKPVLESNPMSESPHPLDIIVKTENAQKDIPVTTPSLQIAEPLSSSRATPDSTDQKTVAVWEAPSGSEPVVGWLVCVKGSYFGQSFSLKTGNNNVGRSMDMDIPLAQENTISRNRHCVITFEPEKQDYFIQPGESTGLTYLNSEVVMSIKTINTRDIIKLGNCEFSFFPLCGDNFNWKNVI